MPSDTKDGMTLIPATDDWHMHNTDSVRCYLSMIEDFGFDLDSIRPYIFNGINAAWQPEEIKARWRREWLSQFDSLRAQLVCEPNIPESLRIRYCLAKKII